MEDVLHYLAIYMEDNLNFKANGRRPQYVVKWKKTSNCWQMEENLKLLANGRQPQFVGNWKTVKIVGKWKTSF